MNTSIKSNESTSFSPDKDIPEIETNILSACLGKESDATLDIILSEITPDDFYDPVNKQIFQLILECVMNEDTPTRLMLYQLGLSRKLSTDVQKRISELNIISVYDTSLKTIRSLCKTLKIHGTRYAIYKTAEKIKRSSSALNGHTNQELINEMYNTFTDCISNNKTKINDLDTIIDIVENEQQKLKEQGWYGKIKTGFPEMDKYLQIMPGNLVILAGWTSHGKTAFALNIANNMIHNKGSVLYVSIEMRNADILYRLAAQNDPYGDLNTFISGNVTSLRNAPGLQVLQDSMQYFHMVDLPAASELEIAMILQSHMMKHPETTLVIIDYFQAVRCDRFPNQNTHRQFSSMAYFFREVAKRLNVPILLISQLKRAEQTSGVTRRLANKYDIKESGDIENAADIVILVNRLFEEDHSDDWYAVINLDKQRQSKKRLFGMRFIGRQTKFHESYLNEDILKPYKLNPKWIYPHNMY